MNKPAALAAAVTIVVLIAGCASGPEVCLTRTEVQRVPTPVFIDLPARFVEPIEIPPLEPPLDNGGLDADIQALEDGLDRANADRAELRRLQRQRKEPDS